jgi:hypothetical protein
MLSGIRMAGCCSGSISVCEIGNTGEWARARVETLYI